MRQIERWRKRLRSTVLSRGLYLMLITGLVLVGVCEMSARPASAESIDDRLSSASLSDETIEARTAKVKGYIEAQNNADLEFIAELFAEDAVVDDPLGSPPHVGRDAIVEFYRTGPFSKKIVSELDGPVRVAGDSAAFAFTAYSDGLKMQIIDVMVFNSENQVVKMTAYWSTANLTKSDQ